MKNTNVRWLLMAFIVFPLTMIMGFDRGIMAVVAPVIQKEYGLTLVQMSILLTAFYWAYAPSNIFTGIWAQKIGPHKGLTIASTWWSLVTLAIPLAITIFPLLIALRMLLGVGQAVDLPASVGFINRWFTKLEKSRASSILLGGQYFGTVMGKPLTAWIMVAFGWQWSFWSFAIIGLFFTWLWHKYVCDNPQDHPMPNEAEKQHIAQGADTGTVTKISWSDYKMFMHKTQFWAFGLQYFLLQLIQSFYIVWLPTYLMATRNLSLQTMGWLAGMPWIALFVSVFIMGAIADRVYKKTKSVRIARIPFAILGFIFSAFFLYLGAVTENLILMTVYLMGSMAGVGMAQVSIWSTCQDIGGPRATVLSGWVSFCGNMGNVVGPTIMALVVSMTGGNWASAMITLAVTGILGAILWLFVNPQRPLVKPEEDTIMAAS